MITLRAPSGASGPLAHAIELVNRDLDGLLEDLDTRQQNEFWTDLQRFAFARTEHPERIAPLIVSDHVNAKVREKLQMFDENAAMHLREVDAEGAAQFWRMLHDVSEEQANATKHPKARHGGGV